MLEAHRIRQRTEYDMEMLKELGFTSGIENYSRILEGRPPGSHPFTLIDYFPDDFVVFVDESHQTVPQLGGMYEGDRSRKQTLVDYGFRLPSALDNRPLRFDEFLGKVEQLVFVSATPGPFELSRSKVISEQLIRPTGIVDPEVELRPTRDQIDDLLNEIRKREEAGERMLVTTLTKKMAEDLTDYLLEAGVGRATCTPRSTRSSGSRSSASFASASTTSSSGSTCCARGSIYPRCRSWRCSTPTRRASCAARPR